MQGGQRAVGASRVRAATALTGTAALAATGGIAWGIAPHRAAAEPTVDVVVVQEMTAPPARAGDPQPTRVLKKRVVKKRIRTSPPPVATSGAS
jgi:hypothetical protein